MTRYNVLLHREKTEYLAACYAPEGSGVYTTLKAEDACSWVLIESAARVARHINENMTVRVSIQHCTA